MPQPGARLAAYATLALVLSLPVLVSDIPSGVDALNHFARIHIRAHIDADPDLAQLFTPRDILIPYLGMDWLLTPLARVLPTLLVARIYEVGLAWGLTGAVMLLSRMVHGHLGYEAAATGLLAYNGLMAWGFINYMLGVIAALLAFAAWYAWGNRPWLWRLGVFGSFCAGLYLVHLLALVAYAVMVGAYETCGRSWKDLPRRAAVILGQFLPPILLWLATAVPRPHGAPEITYDWPNQIVALASPFLFSGALGGVDIGYVTLVLTGFLAVGFTRLGVLTWHRPLLATALAIMLLSVFLPVAVFGIFAINLRLPLVAACLAIAAVQLRPGAALAQSAPLAVWIAILTVLQTGAVTREMARCGTDLTELRIALDSLPRGTVLTPVLERSGATGQCPGFPFYEHAAQLITIERSGYASDFFGDNTSVRSRLYPANLLARDASLVRPNTLSGTILWLHLGQIRPAMQRLRPLHEGSFFSILTQEPGPTPSP